MTRICHLFDRSADWEQRVGASQLLTGLPENRYASHLAVVDPAAAPRLGPLGGRVRVFRRLAGWSALAAPAVARFLDQEDLDLVHAWGLSAAVSADTASDIPLVVELFDPDLTEDDIVVVRTLARPTGFAVACSTQTVRRRLIEGGVPPEVCVVLRPGVDFAVINESRRGPLREQLGLRPDDYVVIVAEPVTRKGRQLEVYWAVELLNHLAGRMRIIVPGESREQRRIGRLDSTGLDSRVVISPGDRLPFEQLVAVSDALVMIPLADATTTAIAWAMAAGAAVIGRAGYAVAELVSHKVNGLLFKPRANESPAAEVAQLLQDRDSQQRTREVARGQAYEVFSLRRYVEQHVRLYDNVQRGTPPAEGITDSAVVT